VTALQAKGLIKGASSANAIVLDERVSPTGRAALARRVRSSQGGRHPGRSGADGGGRVRAHIVATRPSHGGNIALARALTRAAQRGGAPKMDIGRIMDVLPHRYPFLLVDRIIEVKAAAHRRHQERHDQRALLPGAFSRPSHHARVLIIRGDGAGGGMLLMSYFEGQNVEDKVVYSCRSTT